MHHTYLPTKRAMSPIARQAAAQAKEEARRDAWHDAERVLIRAVRAAKMAEHQVLSEAGRVFDRENTPVPPPPQIAGLLHPTRVKALAAFVASWSPDPREAIVQMRTVAEIATDLAPHLAAETARAQDAYADFLAQRRAATFEDDGLPDPALSAVSSEATLNAALDREGVLDGLDLVFDEEAPVLPVRRGPGRPRRVDLDDDVLA